MMLLNKAKMKHRDPKLFYLTMEVGVRKSGTTEFYFHHIALGRLDSIAKLKIRFLAS